MQLGVLIGLTSNSSHHVGQEYTSAILLYNEDCLSHGSSLQIGFIYFGYSSVGHFVLV